MTSVKCLIGGALLLTLTGCAGTYHAYIDNLKLAFARFSDAELNIADVRNSRYDLLYVKSGDRAQAITVLLYLEAGQRKWISADNAMLIEEQGRIVRTLGFGNDLLSLTNTATDPIRRIDSIRQDTNWLRLADWKNGEYGYQIRSHFEVQQNQQLVYFGQSLPVTLVVENVQYETPSNYLRFDGNWQNRFWYEAKTGTLIKSEQLLAPFREPLTMTYISRIVRLLPSDNPQHLAGE